MRYGSVEAMVRWLDREETERTRECSGRGREELSILHLHLSAKKSGKV